MSIKNEEKLKQNNGFDKNMFYRILTYLKPQKNKLVWLTVLAIIVSAFNAFRPYLIKIAIDNYILKNNFVGLIWITIFILVMLISYGFLNYLLMIKMQSIGQDTIHKIRMQLHDKLQILSLRYYDTTPVGRLVTRVTSDVETLNEFFSSGMVMIAANIFTLITISILMFSISVKLSFITIGALVSTLLINVYFSKIFRKLYSITRIQLAKINSFLNENITGVLTVKLFGQEENSNKKFDVINTEYKKTMIKTVLNYSIFFPIIEFISALAIGLIIWFGGKMLILGNPDFGMIQMIKNLFSTEESQAITFGVFFAFFQYTEMFFRPIRDLTDRFDNLQSTMASSERIFELLDNNSVIKEPDNYEPFKIVDGTVEFDNVSFSYDGEREIVHNLSFKVNKGETIAIVGATGAGKTSIINILLKFYDYKSGSVKIDGREINSINSSDLRDDIALVMQDVFLFRGNIKENITLNNDKVKEIEMKLAAETVGISDFVNSQSDGYNTTVQERGATLSVGQKQLISFARALAYNPKILILDEATSNVDTETEVQLQTAIDKLLYGRTSIVVAHRLSTIRKANRILVMHKGELKETGTHEQLIALNGIYSRLYHLQYKMKDDIKVANDDNKENLNLNLN